ncbi:MAG TPA: hypothetical protein VJ885_19945, partial [Thermoanaerobaculia bacterium]|nr:hypothetical protein [Thermoanaerobaculia bacterium]
TGQDREWVDRLYSHPLIQGLSQPSKEEEVLPAGDKAPRSAPSYIPSRTFALTLLEILREPGRALQGEIGRIPDTVSLQELKTRLGAWSQEIPDQKSWKGQASQWVGGIPDNISTAEAKAVLWKISQEPLEDTIARLPNEKLRGTLLALLGESRGNVEELKKNVEIWFNNSMERVSGWYKRRTQLWNLMIAMFTVLLVNADSLVIVQTLADNEALRTALVAQAEAYAEANQALDQAKTRVENPAAGESSGENVAALRSQAEEFQRLLKQIEGLNLPIGWEWNTVADDPHYRRVPSSLSHLGETVAFHLLGWIVSIFAVSLGAPFWFDMLNRVISIRSAGRAPEEKPKSPETVPAPREPGNIPVATGTSGTSTPAEQRLVIEVRGANGAAGG